MGSYWDSNTGLRPDDTFSSFSSYKNPVDPNSGRAYEKPDVTGMGGQVAGGSCIGVETTGVGGGVTNSTCSTSFAAADVSALVGLIIGKQPELRGKGEAVKAIVIAGATHNIVEGKGYRDCSTSPVANDCRDGAGAIDASQTIRNIVVPGDWRFPGSINPASFDASGNIDFPVSIPAGRNIRVAIAWDSTATCTNLGTASQACASDVLKADLDLHLIDPGGNFVAGSSSFQNSAEVLDFKTVAAGTYKVRINRFRFDASTSTWLGVAWNLQTVDRFSPLVSAPVALPLNVAKANQTTDRARSFWDGYLTPAGAICFGSANHTGLEKVYTVTTTQPGRVTATLSSVVGYPGVHTDLDVILLKKTGPANSQNAQMLACGELSAVASNQPAGTYLVVVDGWSGAVAKYRIRVDFVAGTGVARAAADPGQKTKVP